MMGQPAAEGDVESFKRSGGRSSCCLVASLVTSVVCLFVAVAAVAAVATVLVMQTPPAGPRATCVLTGEPGNCQGPNSAYVHAAKSELKNRTMPFVENLQWDTGTVGSNFRFNKDDNSMRPQRGGIYFMYVDVNLTCVHRCAAGFLWLEVGDKLSCVLRLPAKADMEPVSKRCSTVQRLRSEELQTRMTVFSEGQMENWRLELETSGWGMCLLD